MRAHTITTTTRRRRQTRRLRTLALALGICGLAIPATASAEPIDDSYSSVTAITGGSSDSSLSARTATERGQAVGEPGEDDGTPAAESDYSSLNAITGAPASQPTLVSGSPSNSVEGFDWGSAAVGAGAAMALVALGGAGFLTVRRRTPVAPSAASMT